MTSKHPWLTRRENTYYLRAKVPSDIRPFYPRAEVKRSLKTQDKAIASRLIHIEAAAVEKEFAAYRMHRGAPPRPSSIKRYAKGFEPQYRGVGPPPDDLASSEELTNDDIRRLALKYWEHRRHLIDEPTSGLAADDRWEYALQLDNEASGEPADDDALWSRMLELAANTLEENGFYLDRSGSKGTKLGEILLRAESEVLRQRAARLRGHPVPTAFDSYFAGSSIPNRSQFERVANGSSGAPLSLDQLIVRYENDPSRQAVSNKTRTEDRRTFSHLREIFKGHRPIGELGRAECEAFRDLICSIPKDAQIVCRGMTAKEAAAAAAARNLPKLGPKGANKYLHKLSALMRYAIEKGLLSGSNPAHKIALPHRHSIDDRNPFSETQLHLIFSSDEFRAYAARRGDMGTGAAFWVPVLALFMGLRQGEACQLMAHDFEHERGIDCIKIQDNAGRRLKTAAAKRKIPCHPYLKQLGLLDFVESARVSEPLGRLFPEEKLGRDGHFSPFSKRFSRFLGAINARQPKTAFHSFRHNFRDALRNGETPTDLAIALGGWKQSWRSTADEYGSRASIIRLAQEISKVKYDEFPLDEFLGFEPTKRSSRALFLTPGSK